jgi:hypothetical protein
MSPKTANGQAEKSKEPTPENHQRTQMKNLESEYLNAGFTYERAKGPAQVTAASQAIRVLLEAEKPHDQTEARYLIEQGRQEARAT